MYLLFNQIINEEFDKKVTYVEMILYDALEMRR